MFKGGCRSPVDIVNMWKDNIRIIREDQATVVVCGSEHRSGNTVVVCGIKTSPDLFNHVFLQVLCLVAMEKPISLKPEHIKDEKVKVCASPIHYDDTLSMVFRRKKPI